MSRNRRDNQIARAPAQHPERRQPNAVQYRDPACYLYDLPIGDAGSGNVVRKNRFIYAQTIPNVADAQRFPNTRRYVLNTVPQLGTHPDMCRYQFYHVKFYGRTLYRNGGAGAVKPISINNFPPSTADSIFGPQVAGDLDTFMGPTTFTGYIETDDGAFQCFDILGRREFDVYAQSINIGIYAPENSYDIFSTDEDEQVALDGLVEQSLIGATITPIVVNSSTHNDECTICVTVPNGSAKITVPDGARFVSLTIPAAAAGLVTPSFVEYSVPGFEVAIYDPTIAEIIPVPGGETGHLRIPDAPFIRLVNTGPDPFLICATFTEEL